MKRETDSSPAPPPGSSLYIHVPFCARKCDYCAFYSEAASVELMDRYVEAVLLEMELSAAGLKPHTVFFGGGTPSLLTPRHWRTILVGMERCGLSSAEEWTVECNPATVSLDKARLWRDHGVNRVSMGIQSLDPTMLERLGRVHSRQAVFQSFDILRRAGFANINLDLMFAIPGQTRRIWQDTLNEAVALGSEHLSCYEVIYEEDTPLFERLKAGAVKVEDELACAMYQQLLESAAGAGFAQYEVANFARSNPVPSTEDEDAIPSLACQHNVNYWRGGSFVGLGPSATSYVAGVRTTNCADTQRYGESMEAGVRPVDFREQLNSLSRAGETAAFGLRMVAGWPFDKFRAVTGYDLRDQWREEMRQLGDRGWGCASPQGFRLTGEGLRFADAAAELFLR